MVRGQNGQWTYAGALDAKDPNQFPHWRGALQIPLRYHSTPDSRDGDAPFMGKIGLLASRGALVNPIGTWVPNYVGILPYSQMPHIVTPEPWNVRGNP